MFIYHFNCSVLNLYTNEDNYELWSNRTFINFVNSIIREIASIIKENEKPNNKIYGNF